MSSNKSSRARARAIVKSERPIPQAAIKSEAGAPLVPRAVPMSRALAQGLNVRHVGKVL
jgi:hypothetical protein